MQITQIVFSPTGGTQRVVDSLSEALTAKLTGEVTRIDLADPFINETDITVPSNAFAIIAMPCFGGRAPEVAMKRLSRIKGSGAQCVVVNVYGNRAFDDALLEMEDGATAAGFEVVAVIAALAEHSIMRQFATGRPDQTDKHNLEKFAHSIVEQLMTSTHTTPPHVPGKRPYTKASALPIVPKVTGTCVACGKCAESCPVTAINTENYAADKNMCIACMRCIEVCPKNARSINKLLLKVVSTVMKKAFSTRKECELFL